MSDSKSATPRHVDKNWAWFVLVGAVVANILSGGTIYSFGILYNYFLDHSDTSSAETAAIGGLCLGCFWFIAPFGLFLVRRLGYRLTTIIGSAVQALGYLICIAWPNVHFYFLTLGILTGCGSGLIYVASFAVIDDYFQRRWTIATGLVFCGQPMGVVVFASVTRVALDTYEYFGTFLLLSALMLNGIVCGVIFKPLGKKDKITSASRYVRMTDDSGETGDKASPPLDGPSTETADGETDVYASSGDGNEKTRLTKVKKTRYKALEEKEEVFEFSADQISFKLPSTDRSPEEEEYESEVEEVITDDEKGEPKTEVEATPEKEESAPEIAKPEPEVEKERPREPISGIIFGIRDPRMICQCDFVLFLIAVFLFSVGYLPPYFMFPDLLREHGDGNDVQVAGILSIIGLVATAGVAIFWLLAWRLEARYTRVSVLLVLILTCISGLTIAFVRYYSVVIALFFSAIVFGFCSGVFIPLRHRIIVALWGDDSLSDALAWSYWVAGAGSILGPPVAGYLRDSHGTYTWSFVMSAGALCACAVITLPLLFIKRERNRYVRDAI